MPKLIDRYRNWQLSRAQRKVPRLAPAPPPISAETQQLVRRSGLHAFSTSNPTWDDAAQRWTFLGPLTPVYGLAFVDTVLDRLLRASAWSWASINGNAKAMSQLTPIVQEMKGGDWQTAPRSHPLWGFLADPLGTDDTLPWMSWQHLFYMICLHYYGAGNSYLVPVDLLLGDSISVIPLLHPLQMVVHDVDMDKRFEVPRKYTYQRVNGGPQLEFTPDRLINIMAPSASSLWRGTPPLRAALRATQIDAVATERQRWAMINKISPGPVISFDHPLGPTPAQIITEKQRLIDDYRDPENEGDPYIMGSGGKIDKGFTQEELQVFETKKSAREDIIAVIGTQPSILGQLDGATYSNTKEATLLWFNGSLAPIIEIIYGHLNAQLVHRRFGPDVRLWYSLAGSHIGNQLLLAKLDVATGLQTLGYSTNDINAHLELGMPERDYLDKSTGADVIAGRTEPTEEGDPDPEPEEPTDPPESDEPPEPT